MSTEYRCGHCGKPLTEAELDGGVCPHCGAQISPFGDVIQPPPKTVIAGDWPPTFLEPPSEAPPVTTKFTARPVAESVVNEERLQLIRTSRTTGRLAPLTADTPARPPTTGLLLSIGIAVALVFACTIAATGTLLNGLSSAQVAHPTAIARHTTPVPTATYGGLGFPTQAADPTTLPFDGQIPTDVPTSTPYGGIPTPTPRPTIAGPPQLAVSPPVWSDTCKSNHLPTFVVSDAGGGQLSWVATADPGISFSPMSGTVISGQPQTVVVTGAPTTQGSLTFTDMTDAGTAPSTVQFYCK